MKKLFYLLLLISSVSFSQDKEFKFTKDGITDYIITEVDKPASVLYQKTLEWISKTYKNPNEVIKAKVENDYIRIEGFTRSLIVMNSLGKNYYDSNYQIEITFQDGKYKFDVISVDLLNTKSNPVMPLNDVSEYYKKDGSLKGLYKYYPVSFTNFFNNLNVELRVYLSE